MLRHRKRKDPEQAWAPYEPSDAEPWDLARVAHLHRRAGFSASWAVLQRDLSDGPSAAVARLLDGEPRSLDGQDADAFDAFQTRLENYSAASGSLVACQGAWLRRMIFTPRPLVERLTLFWHDHFATSNAKVNNPRLMHRQLALLRGQALGDFRAMLKGIARDPAMLLWLDAAGNRKVHPNENYAREVMELFALGRGHYTEHDIQEAARAFTGAFVQNDEYREVAAQHDDGPKTILGRAGAFRGDDVADILLDQPACATFIARKLYAYFVNEVEEPDDALIEPLAEAFRSADFQIRPVVEMILRSCWFFDRSTLRKRVKCPVELAVGTIRALEIVKPTASPEALAERCTEMGQSLLAPPSVAGWDWGPAWINTTTTLARTNLALALLSDSDEKLGGRLDPTALAARHGASDPDAAAAFFVDLLLQDGIGDAPRARITARWKEIDDPAAATREVLRLVLTAPEYQLA
jgi:uncharacterized protein (DUF1800 family)